MVFSVIYRPIGRKMTPKVSVIIRTKNEEKYIAKCITSLLQQDYGNIEILVVDSGSIDKTLEIVKKGGIKLIEIKPEDFTYGYALNIGCKAAKGEYIALLSAHTIPIQENWLSVLMRNFTDYSIAGVYGKQIPKVNNIPEERDNKLFFPDEVRSYRKNPMFHNANSIIRKNVWKCIPFDEKLTGLEDIDWAKKATDMGYSIIYEPEAAVHHYHKENLGRIYERAKRETLTLKKIGVTRYTHQGAINFTIGYFIYMVRDFLYGIRNKKNLSEILSIPLTRFAKSYGIFRACN